MKTYEKKIVWVTRSFLDYRVPVFNELNKLVNGNLKVVFSGDVTPERVVQKLHDGIGVNAIPMFGERVFGYKGNITSVKANSTIRIPYQPGLLKIIKELEPDVLIGDGFFQWTWVSLCYRFFTKTPLVICYERTRHTERNAQWYRRIFRKFVLRQAEAMCVNGRLSREYVESLGMSPERVTTGHMVADTEGLSQQIASLNYNDLEKIKMINGLEKYCKLFLTVGQIIRRKGVFELLEGWRKFSSQNEPDAALVMVGEGPEKEDLELYCKEQGLVNVVFLGAVDYDEIYKYFAIADVFVIATLEDNWSLVVSEAMVCGKPILCSKYNGCWPELVCEGQNGWVFDPLETDEIVEKFQEAYLSNNLQDMGLSSKRIINSYSPQSAANSIYHACSIALFT